MKHERKRIYLTILYLLMTLGLVVLHPTAARAGREQRINGYIPSSRLYDNAEVVLTKDCSIEVNENKTISNITANGHNLYITRSSTSNGVLTVMQDQAAPAIKAKSITISASVIVLSPLSKGIVSTDKFFLESSGNLTVTALSGIDASNTFRSSGKMKILAVDYGIFSGGELNVQGGSVEVLVEGKLAAAITAVEKMVLSGGTVKAEGGSEGIRSLGPVTVGTTVEATGEDYGIFVKKSDLTVNGNLTCSGKIGAAADHTFEVTSFGTVNAKGRETGIKAGANFINAGKIITSGDTSYGLDATGELNLTGGTVEAEGNEAALIYSRTPAIAPSLVVLYPPGGSHYNYAFWDFEGNMAKSLRIGPGKAITGKISIPQSYQFYVGDPLKVTLSGVPEGLRHFQWKASTTFGTNAGWENIPNTDSEKITTDTDLGDHYVQCYMYVEGYGGILISNDVWVHSGLPVIIQQPKAADCKVGLTTTFTVKANFASTYDWRLYKKNSTAEYILTGKKYKHVNNLRGDNSYTSVDGQLTATLRLTPKNTKMDGLYLNCIVTSPTGATKRTKYVKLSVKESPMPDALPVGKIFINSDGDKYMVTNNIPSALNVEYLKPKSTASGTITIPNTITHKGITYSVVSIAAGAFRDNNKITKAVIGNNVTEIKTSAFRNCRKLQTVVWGKKLKTIGNGAFRTCKRLREVTLGANLRKIGIEAFCYCEKLTYLTFAARRLPLDGIGSKAFSKTPNTLTVFVSERTVDECKQMLTAAGVSKDAKYVVPVG